MAKNIMIQGTMSNVGKSLLCAALCRVLHQEGYRCAPFKSQNMALNSGVTRDGLEMGRAQILQAAAAGIKPDVRMNPVLLKPTSDHRSQVIVNGEVLGEYSAREYFAMKKQLVPDILRAYENLSKEYDVIVIEGAGSPAEINLKQDDIVNMGLAEMADAPVLLAGDIDPGGVFAQLYGTVKLLDEKEQRRIKGLIINKFRGDVSLLTPGIGMLEEKLGIPVLGVLPWMKLYLDEEDSMGLEPASRFHGRPLDAAVIRFPRISNFTDLDPLRTHPLLGVRYVMDGEEFGTPDLVILPGTKSTLADLAWLRETGIAKKIVECAENGTYILGICGGYQMLGDELHDPYGTEGNSGAAMQPEWRINRSSGQSVRGLGLLPAATLFRREKIRREVSGTIREGYLSGACVYGYEIHTGQTVINRGLYEKNPESADTEWQLRCTEDECHIDKPISIEEITDYTPAPGCEGESRRSGTVTVCSRNHILGTYLHGLFDSGEAVDLLVKKLCEKKGIPESSYRTPDRAKQREEQLDLLADAFRRHMDMDQIYRILLRR